MVDPTPADYLRLKNEGKSDEEIAHVWGFATRDAVATRLRKWRAAGLLPQPQPRIYTDSITDDLGSFRNTEQTKYKKAQNDTDNI